MLPGGQPGYRNIQIQISKDREVVTFYKKTKFVTVIKGERMTQQDLTTLTDKQLLEQRKKAKSSNIAIAVLTGMMIGVAVFGAVKGGLSFFTFFPLIFFGLFFNAQKKKRAVEKEVKSRNLE